jgi:tetratricopeptide (TPR) repeat protein
MYLGDAERAETLLEQIKQVQGNAHYFPDTRPSFLYNCGFVDYIRGNYQEARRKWLEALSASQSHGVLTIRVESLAGLGIVSLHRGERAEARKFAGRALRLARHGKYLVDQRFVLEDLIARLHFEEGNVDKALCDLGLAVQYAQGIDKPFYLTAQLTRMELLQRVGKVDESKRAMNELLGEARQLKANWWIDQALRTHGDLNYAEKSL